MPLTSWPIWSKISNISGTQVKKGLCKSAKMEEIEKHNFIMTPGRYVGIPDEEDDGIPFEKKWRF